MVQIYALIKQMLNIKNKNNFNNKINILLKYGYFIDLKKIKLWFFSINVIGRIFQWLRYDTYMDFILPVAAKPTVYLVKQHIAYFLKNGRIFFIFNTRTQYTAVIKNLFQISKPSIFNKRGLNVYNRVYYKKKGKITSYITNK